MESILVEAVRQLPALVLAGLAFYFYRTAQKATELHHDAPAIPDNLIQTLETVRSRAEKLESDYDDLVARLDQNDSREQASEEEREGIRSQLTNQKMALKEFGRVLSKTSEQTYTEFGSLDERLRQVEDALSERGMLSEENRSAAA